MDAKFYLKNLINSSKQNSGEGNQSGEGDQIETDPIKKYLNELATKAIEKGVYYTDVINIESGALTTILNKTMYTTLLQQSQANINSENKIGDENNYEFVIVEYPDNIEDYIGNRKEIFEHTKFIFINEENAIYFLNKFIKVSTKQFMKSVLYSMDFQSMNDIFGDLNINAKNFEEKIAINNIKFEIVTGFGQYIQSIIANDIDLETFYILGRMNQIRCVFDENEDKIIFNFITDTYGTHDEYNGMSFIFSSDSSNEITTRNINGTNYKAVQVKNA